MSSGLAQVGDAWQGYRVVEDLGQQGTAERYRAHAPSGDLVLLDVVAIRHASVFDDLRAADLPRLSHPSLLPILDVITVLQFPALVLENSTGQTLGIWLEGGPPQTDRLRVFRAITDGLAYLHAEGHAHCDLQPGSVLVERSGRTLGARLVYTGVARLVLALVARGASVTSSGAAPGLRGYTPPERARGQGPFGPRSDVFSLGCLLYLLVAGRGPFDGLNTFAAFQAGRDGDYVPLDARAPDAPPAVVALCHDLLRSDPAERPPDANAVVARLDEAGILAPEPPAPSPSLPPLAVAGAAVAAGALVGMVALVWWWLA